MTVLEREKAKYRERGRRPKWLDRQGHPIVRYDLTLSCIIRRHNDSRREPQRKKQRKTKEEWGTKEKEVDTNQTVEHPAVM